jgi:hypothetical protein
MCNGPTNALVCNKTLIQMSHSKSFKITTTCFDHQLIIIRELFDPLHTRQRVKRMNLCCHITKFNTHEDSYFNQWFLTRITSSLTMISWLSKHVGVILSVLMCDIWINVLLHTSALVGPLHIVNWNARWKSEIEMHGETVKKRETVRRFKVLRKLHLWITKDSLRYHVV